MNGQNAFQALLAQNKQVLDQRSASGRSGGQRGVNAFTQAKFPQAPRPNPPAERNPLERTRGDRWRNALGMLLGGDPNIGRQAQQQRDLERFGKVFAASPEQALAYAEQAGRGDLVQYGQGMIEQQKKAAHAQDLRDRQDAIYEQLHAVNPALAAAYSANPEKTGEYLASNFGAATVGQGETRLRDTVGLNNYSVAPEAKVVGSGEVLAGQNGQILAQGPEAQPDLPTGMVMGPNGPEYIPGYLEGQERLRQAGRDQTTINTGSERPSTFAEALDKNFAPIYTEWSTGAGADMVNQIGKIKDVVARIDAGENISGLDVGLTPDLYKVFQNPGAIDARETVEEVVQRNLRLILGAQFTEKEGERLISRAFNPKLDESLNRQRLVRLMTQMETAAQQTQAMVDYARTYGTLDGYSGNVPRMQDFFDAVGPENTPDPNQKPPNMSDSDWQELQALRAELGGQ